MAQRPAWKGYLKLSLVTCAVELSSATTQSDKVSFRTLSRSTGNTVRRQYVDADTGKPVGEKDEVRGYEIGKNEFVLVEDEEIEAVQIESSHTLNLESFVPKSEVDEVYLDTPYYLAPADKVSAEAFAVIREALSRRKMAGLARIVLFRRERPVLIEAFGKGMLLTTLRYDKTVRQPEAVVGGIETFKTDGETLRMAEGIIEGKKGRFSPDTFDDPYENALIKLIKAKRAGKKTPAAKAAKKPSNVVSLFDALKKSLSDQEKLPARKSGTGQAKARKKKSA